MLKKINNVDDSDLMDLLKSQMLVERTLSKLLGPGKKDQEERKDNVSLSESILKFYKSKEC